MKNMWRSGIMGVVVGDALGAPVQFETREQVKAKPISGMTGYRTFNMAPGSWTDDSSLTLALVDSIIRCKRINAVDIMGNFVGWLDEGLFTPYGFAFDIGRGTMNAIKKYEREHNAYTCGGRDANNNGNGSLMRIMPVVLYCIQNALPVNEAIDTIHTVSALTHAHSRAKIACGLYYFMANAVVNDNGTLLDRLQNGLDVGFEYYEAKGYDDLRYLDRLKNLSAFKAVNEDYISTSGYVVDTLEAAVWGLITTKSFDEALLKLANMGDDTDSVDAVAGGLAGLYYGYDAIPTEWLDVIKRRDWMMSMLDVLDGSAK